MLDYYNNLETEPVKKLVNYRKELYRQVQRGDLDKNIKKIRDLAQQIKRDRATQENLRPDSRELLSLEYELSLLGISPLDSGIATASFLQQGQAYLTEVDQVIVEEYPGFWTKEPGYQEEIARYLWMQTTFRQNPCSWFNRQRFLLDLDSIGIDLSFFENKEILEVGANRGDLFDFFRQKKIGFKNYLGIDWNLDILQYRDNKPIFAANNKVVPFKDRAFDLIIFNSFLGPIHQEEIRRLLRPSGQVLVSGDERKDGGKTNGLYYFDRSGRIQSSSPACEDPDIVKLKRMIQRYSYAEDLVRLLMATGKKTAVAMLKIHNFKEEFNTRSENLGMGHKLGAIAVAKAVRDNLEEALEAIIYSKIVAKGSEEKIDFKVYNFGPTFYIIFSIKSNEDVSQMILDLLRQLLEERCSFRSRVVAAVKNLSGLGALLDNFTTDNFQIYGGLSSIYECSLNTEKEALVAADILNEQAGLTANLTQLKYSDIYQSVLIQLEELKSNFPEDDNFSLMRSIILRPLMVDIRNKKISRVDSYSECTATEIKRALEGGLSNELRDFDSASEKYVKAEEGNHRLIQALNRALGLEDTKTTKKIKKDLINKIIIYQSSKVPPAENIFKGYSNLRRLINYIAQKRPACDLNMVFRLGLESDEFAVVLWSHLDSKMAIFRFDSCNTGAIGRYHGRKAAKDMLDRQALVIKKIVSRLSGSIEGKTGFIRRYLPAAISEEFKQSVYQNTSVDYSILQKEILLSRFSGDLISLVSTEEDTFYRLHFTPEAKPVMRDRFGCLRQDSLSELSYELIGYRYIKVKGNGLMVLKLSPDEYFALCRAEKIKKVSHAHWIVTVFAQPMISGGYVLLDLSQLPKEILENADLSDLQRHADYESEYRKNKIMKPHQIVYGRIPLEEMIGQAHFDFIQASKLLPSFVFNSLKREIADEIVNKAGGLSSSPATSNSLATQARFPLHNRPFRLLIDIAKKIEQEKRIKIFFSAYDDKDNQIFALEKPLNEIKNPNQYSVKIIRKLRNFWSYAHGVLFVSKPHYFELKLFTGSNTEINKNIFSFFKAFFANRIKRRDGKYIDVNMIDKEWDGKTILSKSDMNEIFFILGIFYNEEDEDSQKNRTSKKIPARALDSSERMSPNTHRMVVEEHTPDYKSKISSSPACNLTDNNISLLPANEMLVFKSPYWLDKKRKSTVVDQILSASFSKYRIFIAMNNKMVGSFFEGSYFDSIAQFEVTDTFNELFLNALEACPGQDIRVEINFLSTPRQREEKEGMLSFMIKQPACSNQRWRSLQLNHRITALMDLGYLADKNNVAKRRLLNAAQSNGGFGLAGTCQLLCQEPSVLIYERKPDRSLNSYFFIEFILPEIEELATSSTSASSGLGRKKITFYNVKDPSVKIELILFSLSTPGKNRDKMIYKIYHYESGYRGDSRMELFLDHEYSDIDLGNRLELILDHKYREIDSRVLWTINGRSHGECPGVGESVVDFIRKESLRLGFSARFTDVWSPAAAKLIKRYFKNLKIAQENKKGYDSDSIDWFGGLRFTVLGLPKDSFTSSSLIIYGYNNLKDSAKREIEPSLKAFAKVQGYYGIRDYDTGYFKDSCLLAIENHRAVGFLKYGILESWSEGVIKNIAVRERNRGIGKRLVGHCLNNTFSGLERVQSSYFLAGSYGFWKVVVGENNIEKVSLGNKEIKYRINMKKENSSSFLYRLSSSSSASKVILVLCRQNRERSPLVAALLNGYLPEVKEGKWKVVSAGIKRYVLDKNLESWARRNYILTGHTPREADSDIVEKASLILVMTESQKEKVISKYPDSSNKILKLLENDLHPRGKDYPQSGATYQALTKTVFNNFPLIHRRIQNFFNSKGVASSSSENKNYRGDRSSSSVNVLKADGMAEGLRLINTALKNLNESTNGAFTICIDGDVSTGKTTLAALLRRKMPNTEKFALLSIGIDGIIADLIEEGLTPLFAFLEVPFMLSERIRPDERIIYIIEGTQSVDYVSQAGFKPDIVIFINTSKTRQLLRHLRRYGPFAFKYLLEDYEKSAVPAGTRYVIEIYNPAILNRFSVGALFSSSSIRNFNFHPTDSSLGFLIDLMTKGLTKEMLISVLESEAAKESISDLAYLSGFSFRNYLKNLDKGRLCELYKDVLEFYLLELIYSDELIRVGLAQTCACNKEKPLIDEANLISYMVAAVFNKNGQKFLPCFRETVKNIIFMTFDIYSRGQSKNKKEVDIADFSNDFSSSTIIPTHTYKGRLRLFDSWFGRKYPYAEGNFADLGIGMMINEDGLVVPQTTLEFAKQFPNLKVYGIDSIIPAVSVRIKDYWGMFFEQGKLMAVMEESRETSGGYILEETAVDARIKSRFIQLYDNALKENPDMSPKRIEFSASQEVIFRPYEIAAVEENIENIEFIESSFKDLKEIFKNTRFNYGRVFNINLHYSFKEALKNLKDIAGVFKEGGVLIEGQTIGKQSELLFAEYELIKGKIVPEELWVFKKYSGLFSHSETSADRFIPTIFRLGEYKKFFTILKNAYIYLIPRGFTPGSKEFNRELNMQLKQYYEILELPAISSMLGLSIPQKYFAIGCKSSSPIYSFNLQSWHQAYKHKDLSNPEKIINHKDLPGSFSQIAQMGHTLVEGIIPWSGGFEGQLWLGEKKIGTFLKYRSAKYKLEIIDGFPVTIYFDRDKACKDFLPIADSVSLRIIEFYFSRINKEDLDSYREIEIVTRLNNSGALSIIGGKPWANGEKTKRQRPWAKFRNYPGELVVATVRDGLVFRCRSLESELDQSFALVWDQRRQRYLASFWGKIQKEDFNLLDSRHQIHNYSLSKDGSLLLGGQEWFNFGRAYSYKKAFITEIINSAGRTFVISAQLRQQDQVLTQRRLLLAYELLTDSPAELFLKGDLVAVFERFSRDKINRQAGREIKNYIVSTVNLGAGGFLDLDGFGGSFRHYPGAKTEVMFLDGSKAMVKFIEDAKGRPILDREGNPLVIDIRKDIRGQVFSKSGRSNKLRLEKLTGKAREAKQLLSREDYREAKKLFRGMLHARRKRENQAKGEEELFAVIDFYLAYIELMESLKPLLDRREYQDLAAREIIEKGEAIEKSFQRGDYLKANDDLADFENEVKILSLHKHTKKLADCLNYYQIVNGRENAVCAPAEDISGNHKRRSVFIKKDSLKNGIIKIGNRRFDLNRHIDAGQRNAAYEAELEEDLPLRIKIKAKEEKIIEFKRVIDNRDSRLVDVFLRKINRDKLASYEDVSVPVKLDSQGKLWLAGGRPNACGLLPLKNKAWGCWMNHPGERGFAVIKRGLVHRFISVDSNLDDELSLVWDDKERKYLTSFKSLTAAEFHSLPDSAQIHNHKLAAKGEAYFATYSCRTRSAAIMFGSDFAYRRAKLFISNPSGEKAFITGGEVIDAKGKLIRKELSLAYRRWLGSLPMREMLAGEEEDDQLWQVLSLEYTFQFMQKELLARLDNHIIRNVYFSEAGILNFTEYIGASGKLKGSKIEIAVSGGQARFIRVIEDRFGRPVLDKEKKTLVIDLNKGLVNQLKEKTYLTEPNQGEVLTRLRDELNQLIDAPEQIIDKLAKVITGYGFNSKWKTRLTGIYRKYGILDQSAGLTHVSAQRVLAQIDFDFSQLSPLVPLHQVRDILGIHLGVEFPRKIKLNTQENLSNLFNPKRKNSSRRIYPTRESAKKALMARPQQERTAKSLNRRAGQGGDFTLLYACRKFGIELPREINSREEQLSGYDRFKQELIRRNMAEYGSQELFALWEDAQTGNKEARLQLIEYFTPLVVNIAEGNGNSVQIDVVGNVYGQRQFYLDDDIGRGNLSLIEALDQWSPQREESLFDYTVRKIKEAIVSGRKQASAEKYRLKSIDQPWGNKGGNYPSGKGKMPTNQRTLGDSLGSDQTASMDRFVLMQEVLSSIQNEDYSFLGSANITLDTSMIVSRGEKLSLKESLKKYFLKQGISKAISSRFGVWIIASMGRVGLARKKSSDLNLMVVTDTTNGQLKESAIALRNLIGSGKVSETRKDCYTVTLEKDPDALAGLQLALDAPEFMSLLNSHNIGGNGKLASLELFTVEGVLNGNNSHLERARFHITEDIYRMGANGILVLESEEGFSGYVQERLKEKLTTETMDYEYFMNEYILQFFAKQVVKLQNEQKSLNPAKKLFDERVQITERPEGVCICLLDALPEDVSVYRPFISSIAARYKDETIYVDDPLIMGEALERKAAIIEGQTDELAKILGEESDYLNSRLSALGFSDTDSQLCASSSLTLDKNFRLLFGRKGAGDFSKIKNFLHDNGLDRSRCLFAPAFGSDLLLSVYFFNPSVIVAVDILPFGGYKELEKGYQPSLKKLYLHEKNRPGGYADSYTLSRRVKFLGISVLWELELLGFSREDLKRPTKKKYASGSNPVNIYIKNENLARVDFFWNGQWRILYFFGGVDVNLCGSYPRKLKRLLEEADSFLYKAFHPFKLGRSALDFIFDRLTDRKVCLSDTPFMLRLKRDNRLREYELKKISFGHAHQQSWKSGTTYLYARNSSIYSSSSLAGQKDFFKQDFLALTDREIESDFSLKALYHNPDTKVITMERADVTAFEDSISFFAVEKDTDQIKSRLKKQEKTVSRVSGFKPRVKIILKIISDVLNNKYKFVPKYPMICSGATMICREVFMSLGYQVQTLWTKDIHYFLRVYLSRDKYKRWGVTIDLTSFQFGQEGISKLNLDIETIVLKIKENRQIFKNELEDIITQYDKIPIKKLTLADRDSLITAFLKLYFLIGKTNFSGYKQWIYRAVWKASALQHKNQRMLWQNSLRKMYRAALIRINPYMCIRDYVKRNNKDNSLVIGKNSYDLEKIEKIIIAGIGSFAFLISKAFLEICRDKIGEGLIITNQKQGLPKRIGKINIVSVDKDKIGRKNIEAAHKIKEIVSRAGSKDLVIMIDSDETAKLMVFPETVVSLRDYIDTINLLAGSVDNISEINKVVQSIDKLKGDKMRKLAREAGHFITIALAGIFVFEDKPFIVEDGVAAESRYTFRDAFNVLNKYYLWEKVPASIRFYIKKGLEGKLKINSAGYDSTIVKVSSQYLVSRNNYLACKSVAKKAWKLGYRPKLMQRRLNEEVGVAARIIFEEIKKHLSSPFPVALIWGGDLRLRDDIKNLVKDIPAIHLVLDIAKRLSQEEIKNVKFLAADTEKGFNDSNVSGAMADYRLIKKARACQVDSNGCLIDFRNVSFLEGLGYEVNLDVEAIGISDIMVALVIPSFGKDNNIFSISDQKIAEGTGDSDTDWYIKILNSGFSSSSAIGSQRRVVGRELDLYKRLEKIVDSEIYYLGLSEKSSDQEIIYKIGRRISSKKFIAQTVFELSLALMEKNDHRRLIKETHLFQRRYELIKSSKLFFLIGCPFSALSVSLILKGSNLEPVAVTSADEFHIFSGAEDKRGILLLDFTDSYSKRMKENFTYLKEEKIKNLGLTVYRNQAAFSTILAYAYQNIAAMYQELEHEEEMDKYLKKSMNYRKLSWN
ncbi:MAG: DUF4147 domain-containing protein [Candidatus Omnitrophica bacterium]|nr:DUF4147 domain-containing protein [Candidatus Omnitrophota bacterium]